MIEGLISFTAMFSGEEGRRARSISMFEMRSSLMMLSGVYTLLSALYRAVQNEGIISCHENEATAWFPPTINSLIIGYCFNP